MPGNLLPQVFTKPGFIVRRQDCTLHIDLQQPTHALNALIIIFRTGVLSHIAFVLVCLVCSCRLSAGFGTAQHGHNHDAKAAAEADGAACTGHAAELCLSLATGKLDLSQLAEQ